MNKPKAEYRIQTVANALRLLEAFRDDDELGVSELSRRLGLHKNNVFRLLATLEESGYIEQSSENERYRLGVCCFELGRAYSESHSLLRVARPILQALARKHGETVHLARLEEFEVAHLDGAQAGDLLASTLRVGQRLPSHCTALGKVLLGCATGPERAGIDVHLASAKLDARSAATIVDRDKLLEHLSGVANQGFAVDVGECAEGLHCAAAPVFGGDGMLCAALSISGPASRLAPDLLLRRVTEAVGEAAEGLSRQLGYVS